MHENTAIIATMAVDITNRLKKVNINTLEELIVCLIVDNQVDALDTIIEKLREYGKGNS